MKEGGAMYRNVIIRDGVRLLCLVDSGEFVCKVGEM